MINFSFTLGKKQYGNNLQLEQGLNWVFIRPKLLQFSAHAPLHQSCLCKILFQQRILQFWLLLGKCFNLFQLWVCPMVFNQSLVWCSHNRVNKFPAITWWHQQSLGKQSKCADLEGASGVPVVLSQCTKPGIIGLVSFAQSVLENLWWWKFLFLPEECVLMLHYTGFVLRSSV